MFQYSLFLKELLEKASIKLSDLDEWRRSVQNIFTPRAILCLSSQVEHFTKPTGSATTPIPEPTGELRPFQVSDYRPVRDTVSLNRSGNKQHGPAGLLTGLLKHQEFDLISLIWLDPKNSGYPIRSIWLDTPGNAAVVLVIRLKIDSHVISATRWFSPEYSGQSQSWKIYIKFAKFRSRYSHSSVFYSNLIRQYCFRHWTKTFCFLVNGIFCFHWRQIVRAKWMTNK